MLVLVLKNVIVKSRPIKHSINISPSQKVTLESNVIITLLQLWYGLPRELDYFHSIYCRFSQIQAHSL